MFIGALLSGGAPSYAREAGAAKTVIVVEANRTPANRSHHAGAVVKAEMPVRYGDLNLHDKNDVARLRVRVRRGAVSACEHLDSLLPLEPDTSCLRTTLTRIAPQVAVVIASADRN
ncbi:UrcA family protein [Novosphingobium sp. Rr 2-17]|uniref:UrcA family protein n=1 Tax=Novosphingobium sp. Rr 2-17 TaxID=555793 RepID=UPI0005B92E63|nr:UrcA family protein [Novosphingobium sp. Rr 2-17]